MIFQNYNLVYRLSVIENVMHGRLGNYSAFQSTLGLYRKEDVEEAQRLLQMLGLQDRLYEKCSKLSGGQKQRVGIARALLQHPKMILCDEPIASLDPQSSKVIMEYLRDIATSMNIHVWSICIRWTLRCIILIGLSACIKGKLFSTVPLMIWTTRLLKRFMAKD